MTKHSTSKQSADTATLIFVVVFIVCALFVEFAPPYPELMRLLAGALP